MAVDLTIECLSVVLRGAVLALVLLSAPAGAEDLPDPTRPPLVVAAPDAERRPAPVGLQSVILSKERSAAIIDGQTIELGGKYGDVRLIEVTDTGVVLRGARGKRVRLTLFPGVTKSLKQNRAAP